MALSRSFVTVIVALVACHLAQGQATVDTCDPGIARLCLGISNQTDCGTNDLCQFYQDQETCGPAATCTLNANIIEWQSVQLTFTNDNGTTPALAVDGGDCESETAIKIAMCNAAKRESDCAAMNECAWCSFRGGMFCSYSNAACKKGDLEYVTYVPGHECMVVEEGGNKSLYIVMAVVFLLMAILNPIFYNRKKIARKYREWRSGKDTESMGEELAMSSVGVGGK